MKNSQHSLTMGLLSLELDITSLLLMKVIGLKVFANKILKKNKLAGTKGLLKDIFKNVKIFVFVEQKQH